MTPSQGKEAAAGDGRGRCSSGPTSARRGSRCGHWDCQEANCHLWGLWKTSGASGIYRRLDLAFRPWNCLRKRKQPMLVAGGIALALPLCGMHGTREPATCPFCWQGNIVVPGRLAQPGAWNGKCHQGDMESCAGLGHRFGPIRRMHQRQRLERNAPDFPGLSEAYKWREELSRYTAALRPFAHL